MKINRKSWHYKVSHWGEHREKWNDTLCGYFWRVVLKLAVVAIAITFVAAFTYTIFTSPFVISALIAISSIAASIILPIVAVVGIRKLLGKSPSSPYENIFISYVKARKDKLCPFIDYVD